jgi:hypothetical protein
LLNSNIMALLRADSAASRMTSPHAGQKSPVTPGMIVPRTLLVLAETVVSRWYEGEEPHGATGQRIISRTKGAVLDLFDINF